MKPRMVLSFVVFAVISVAASVALAEPCPDLNVNVVDEVQQEWWMVLLDALLQAVAPIAIAVLTTLSSIAIRKWGSKLDQDKQVAFIRLADSIVTGGITFAEEQARKALKVDGAKTPSAEKLQSAVDFSMERFRSSGTADIARDELVKLIEARLHMERVKPDGVIASDTVEIVEEPDEPEKADQAAG